MLPPTSVQRLLFLLLSAATVATSSASAPSVGCAFASSPRKLLVSSGRRPSAAPLPPPTLLSATVPSDDSTPAPATEVATEDDGLTPQERILRDLGLAEPETEEAKAARIQKLEAERTKLKTQKITNVFVAILAFGAALINYGWKVTHPVTAVEVLAQMQRSSDPITLIGNNGKPTVVDFWAPWCDNCKVAAPTLRSVEKEYGDRVNFVMVNGDLGGNWPLIERFGVDAIPHMAFVSAEGDVETALIGPIPRSVLRADLDALLERAGTVTADEVKGREPLPYVMFDAFRNQPELRRVKF